MVYIDTDFHFEINHVNLGQTRVYQTDCDDTFLTRIIDINRERLEGINLPSCIFVLTENEDIEDINEAYASISFQEIQRDADYLYVATIVTCENIFNKEECLRRLFNLSLEFISGDNIRLQVNDFSIGLLTDEHINQGVTKLIECCI